jgi:hypothetical protein
MISIREEIAIAAPPEAVWPIFYLANYDDRVKSWITECKSRPPG